MPRGATLQAAAKRAGARLVSGQRLEQAQRRGGVWILRTREATFEGATIVNAAGAWADRVAEAAGERPLGIQPYRRTLAQLRIAPGVAPDLPLVIDARDRF
ncbi:MAG TPA: FAD-dependent oxidoreductase, partial [Allosphingosinicella sp.]